LVTVPTNVTFAAWTTQTTFTLKTQPVNANTVVTITVGSGAGAQTTKITILPAQLSSVAINPNIIVGGTGAVGTVTLMEPSGSAGAVVRLSSSLKGLSVPATVVVPAGATSATFIVKTTLVQTNQAATVTATLNSSSQTANVTIAAPALAKLTLSPSSVARGSSSTGTIQLTLPAPPGGLFVALSSSNGGAQVPPLVLIPSGVTSATFVVKTSHAASQPSAIISATLNQQTVKTTLTLTGN
jgi:hypothetical protein